MKELLIVANWKMNKTASEIREWFGDWGDKGDWGSGNLTVVICPPFPYLPLVSELIPPPMKLGAQDVSAFEEGSYTGEVSAGQLKDLAVEYVIVGHSERRQNFGETNKIVNQKIEFCLEYELKPIVCVSRLEEVGVLKTLQLPTANCQLSVSFEPLSAVGTGNPATPENAQKMALAIKEILREDVRVLYGGSVNQSDAQSFIQQTDIAGLLIGAASLGAWEFSQIVRACQSKF